MGILVIALLILVMASFAGFHFVIGLGVLIAGTAQLRSVTRAVPGHG
jgi:hypothetical protein